MNAFTNVLNFIWRLPKTLVGIIFSGAFASEVVFLQNIDSGVKAAIILLTLSAPILFIVFVSLLQNKKYIYVAGSNETLMLFDEEGKCLKEKRYILPYQSFIYCINEEKSGETISETISNTIEYEKEKYLINYTYTIEFFFGNISHAFIFENAIDTGEKIYLSVKDVFLKKLNTYFPGKEKLDVISILPNTNFVENLNPKNAYYIQFDLENEIQKIGNSINNHIAMQYGTAISVNIKTELLQVIGAGAECTVTK